jgi:hypothetical protein
MNAEADTPRQELIDALDAAILSETNDARRQELMEKVDRVESEANAF